LNSSTRSGRSLRRSLGLTAAAAMVLAAMPAGFAAADEHDTLEPRDTSLVCQAPYDADFPDVDSNNVHEENILCAADYGITLGKRDGTYAPSDDIRRDQMASMIARWVEDVMDTELEGADDDRFNDVDEDNVHRENINKLAEANIVRGADVEGTTYNPARSVTRQQMTSFIARALSYIEDGDATEDQPPTVEEDYFPDVDENNPHFRNINALAAVGIAVGYENGNFGPGDNVRRDQMASFIMRGYDWAVEAGLLPSPFRATITDIEVDTSERAPSDELLEEVDTADEGAVHPGDQWILTFSEAMDTDTEGNQIWVDDADGDEYRFECVEDEDFFEVTADENFAVTCEFDEDGLELNIQIIEAPAESDDDGASFFLSADYPLEITTTAGFETADGIEGINLRDSERTIALP
jgi:hypothetical protein